MKHVLLLATMFLLPVGAFAQSLSLAKQDGAQEINSVVKHVKSSHRYSPRNHEFDKNLTIISQEEPAPGVKINIVKNSRGQVFRMLDGDVAQSRMSTDCKAAMKAPSNQASFYEGFEDHPYNYGDDWIPEGWTEINTDANKTTDEKLARYYNTSWHCDVTGDGYWLPVTPEGERQMFIHFSWTEYDTSGDTPVILYPASEQDEWLITPAIDVKAGQVLSFAGMIDIGSLVYFDYSTNKYDRELLLNNLEILVSADDKQTWTKIWDAWNDHASAMTDEELRANKKCLFYDYVLDMSEYANQTVNIAFRYINKYNPKNQIGGNSMAIDALAVDMPSSLGTYELPYGSMIVGWSKNFSELDYACLAMPAFADINWEGNISELATASQWTFYNGEDAAQTIDGTDATYSFTPGLNNIPQLTASNDKTSTTYQWGQTDETPAKMLNGGQCSNNGTVYGYGNFDIEHLNVTPAEFAPNQYVYGTGSDSKWNAHEIAFGNLFEKPASPLYVEEAYVLLGGLDADDDAEFNLTVYKVSENKEFGAPIAHGKALASDAIIYNEAGFKMYTLPFKFYKDNGDGTEKEVPFILDDNAYFEISGFADNDKVRKFGAMAQYENHPSGKNFAYLRYIVSPTSGMPYEYLAPASEMLKNYNSSVCISLNGTFGFLQSETTDVTITEDAITKDVTVTTCCAPTKLIASANGIESQLSSAATFDWLTVQAKEGEQEGEVILTFSAPATSKARTMTVTIDALGVKRDFTVSQEISSAVNDIEVNTSNLTVSSASGVVTLQGASEYAGESVQLFDTIGRLIGQATVTPTGTASITTDAKGIYVLHIGNTSMKVTIK